MQIAEGAKVLMKRADELRYLVLAAQREGSRLFAEQIRPLGLTPSQAEVLSVLHEAQPLSLIELGSRLVCETGSPSRLVDGLVKAGLVERIASSKDQRKVSLTLMGARERDLYMQANGIALVRRVLGDKRMIGSDLQFWISLAQDP